MGNALFQAICRTGIFMICAQAITHFRPQESYEKYLKLLVSAMVLIQLFLPIGGVLAGVDGKTVADRMEEFRESLAESMEEARLQAIEQEALLERMTLEEVRRRMEEQAVQESQGTQTRQGTLKDMEDTGQLQMQLSPSEGEEEFTDIQDITITIQSVETILGN